MKLGWFNDDPGFDPTGCHDGTPHAFVVTSWKAWNEHAPGDRDDARELTCSRCLMTVVRK